MWRNISTSFPLKPWTWGPHSSGKKKTDLWGPEIAGWAGGLPHKGVAVEKFVPSLEGCFFGFWELCPVNFARTSRTQKVCAQRRRFSSLAPNSPEIRMGRAQKTKKENESKIRDWRKEVENSGGSCGGILKREGSATGMASQDPKPLKSRV